MFIIVSVFGWQSNWNETVDNFDNMSLNENLLRGIYAYGFEKPSAIQQRAIIPCVRGMDVIAQAQSGTGKTATFAVSILQKIDISLKECQALILAPTRELAQQVNSALFIHSLSLSLYLSLSIFLSLSLFLSFSFSLSISLYLFLSLYLLALSYSHWA